MSELESSGLLEREPHQPASQPSMDAPATTTTDAAARASASATQSADSEQASTPVAEPNLAATIVSAVTDDQAEAPLQTPEADSLSEQQPANASDAAGDAENSEVAEQRVLGDLEGAPTWREVLLLSHTTMSPYYLSMPMSSCVVSWL